MPKREGRPFTFLERMTVIVVLYRHVVIAVLYRHVVIVVLYRKRECKFYAYYIAHLISIRILNQTLWIFKSW
jgi:hypothetical protein